MLEKPLRGRAGEPVSASTGRAGPDGRTSSLGHRDSAPTLRVGPHPTRARPGRRTKGVLGSRAERSRGGRHAYTVVRRRGNVLARIHHARMNASLARERSRGGPTLSESRGGHVDVTPVT
jgi:hypothetical protein